MVTAGDEVRKGKERSSLIAGLTPLAYIEDDSVMLLQLDGLEEQDFERLSKMPSEFGEFCDLVAANLDESHAFFQRIKTATFGSGWINSPPIQRMIREHWFWRWHELVEVLKLAHKRTGDSIAIDDFGPLSFHYIKVAADGADVIVTSIPSTRSVSQASDDELEEAFGRFNGEVARHWKRESETWHREIGPRFSSKALVKAAQARSVLRQDQLRLQTYSGSYEGAFGFFLRVADDATLAEIAELAVILSVNNSMISAPAGSMIDFTSELQPFIQNIVQGSAKKRKPNFSVGLSRLLEARGRLGRLSWGRYFQESLSLLEARMRRHTYVNIVPTLLFLRDRSLFWDRTCRFLSRVLLVSEVTIYRYSLAESGAPLELRGSYCDGPGGQEKSEYKAGFMREAGAKPEQRSDSASYRAADLNRTQTAPDRLGALVPPSSKWKWGHSVLAVPIVNNGGVWGVIEFAADRPHQFGALLAPHCEAAASLISSNLMIGSLFETLNRLDTYALQPAGSTPEKDLKRRSDLCGALADAFNATSLTLFVATRNEDGQHIRVSEYGEWTSGAPNEASSEEIEAVRDFLDKKEVQSREVDAEMPESGEPTTRSFLVRLGADASNGWAGALRISVAQTVDVDAVWTRNLFALARVLAPSIANITSAQSWSPSSRRQIRHESGRVTNTLNNIRTGLQVRLLTKVRTDVDRALSKLGEKDREEMSAALKDVWRSLDQTMVDLQTGINSMRLITTSLSYDIFDPLLLTPDTRLVGIQQSRDRYLRKSLVEVDLREAVVSAFQTALRGVPDRQLRLAPVPESPLRLLRMDPDALSAILGTLAENAAKYSAPFSSILVTFRDFADGLRMSISNLATPLQDGEQVRLFDYGVRGKAAMESHPTQGSGLGLGFAKAAMEMWDGFLDYREEAQKSEQSGKTATKAGEPLTWHRLVLTFPRSMVIS